MSVHETKIKCFKVILSTKHEIQVDRDEIDTILSAIESGSVVRLKQGIFNPSYFVAVVDDEKRRYDFLEDTKYEPERRAGGLIPLADVFAEKLKALPKPVQSG